MAGYNFKEENEVREYLKNLYSEYTFGCYGEKRREVCHLLGDYLESIKRDFKGAASLYQKNCDNLDYPRSCGKFGSWKLFGRGCKKDMIEGFKYLQRGCELNDGISCTNAGILAIGSSDITAESGESRQAVIKLGVNMLKKACLESNEERACSFLASFYTQGVPGSVDADLTESYRYSLRACDYGNPNACVNVSQMLEFGTGVEPNVELAKTYRERASEIERQMRDISSQIEFGQGAKV